MPFKRSPAAKQIVEGMLQFEARVVEAVMGTTLMSRAWV